MNISSLSPVNSRARAGSSSLRNDVFLHSTKIIGARFMQIPLTIIMGLVISKLVSTIT
jgi:hypothetical protein